MKIKETLNFFLNLKNDSVEKSEIKVYDKYIGILSDLKNRDLTQNQIQSIESELEVLNLNIESDNRKKHFTKKLTEFEKFLKDKLSLIPEGHYMSYGMIFGMLAGALLQFYIGIYSLIAGMLIGMVIGAIMDSEARKQGRVLKTKTTE
ncbi:MAG: hypothetical protein ACJAVD_000969 [Porticoccaceae bacterium]|jgi:hypothetical protein|nr:hypothetical protein H7F37_03940 [Winogradskyella sp. PAMC22761]|tara:strand:+ start:66 stop:509 length:444 start_codon:yes stop_codon:yes gene_type:complete